MPCDLCGKQGPTKHSRVEGTVYKVCSSCASFGEPVREVVKRKQSPRRQEDVRVRDDAASVLRKARGSEKQKEFSQRLGVKESQLHAWESGSRKPTIEQARTLEKRLGVSLVEAVEEFEAMKPMSASSDSGLTIGDMLKRR